jgi:hypothetical protein
MRIPTLLSIVVCLGTLSARQALAAASDTAAKPTSSEQLSKDTGDSHSEYRQGTPTGPAKQRSDGEAYSGPLAANRRSVGKARTGVKATAAHHPQPNLLPRPHGSSQPITAGPANNVLNRNRIGTAGATQPAPRELTTTSGSQSSVRAPLPGAPPHRLASAPLNHSLPGQSITPRGTSVSTLGGPPSASTRMPAVLNGTTVQRRP